MYSGAGLTLATVAGVVVKAVAEARDGASLAMELAYESFMLVAAADEDTAACEEDEPKGAAMLQQRRQTQSVCCCLWADQGCATRSAFVCVSGALWYKRAVSGLVHQPAPQVQIFSSEGSSGRPTLGSEVNRRRSTRTSTLISHFLAST